MYNADDHNRNGDDHNNTIYYYLVSICLKHLDDTVHFVRQCTSLKRIFMNREVALIAFIRPVASPVAEPPESTGRDNRDTL